MTISEHNSEEWYSPAEALEILEKRHGASAKALVMDKLREGQVRAHADKIWQSDEPSLSAAWRNRDNAEAEYNVEVARKIWGSTRHAGFDLEQSKWHRNRFVVTRRKNPADRTILTGLKFYKKDIDKLAITARSKSGRKVNHEGWANFFVEIIELERDNKLTKDAFPQVGKFSRHIVNAIAAKGLGNKVIDDDSMEKTASKIWNKLIAPLKA